MALIKCEDCGKDVSDSAAACPNCARPMRDLPPAQTVIVQSNAPSTGIAALLSFLIPGAGSMYMGSVGLGLVLFCMTVVGYFLFILPGLVMHMVTILIAATSKPQTSART